MSDTMLVVFDPGHGGTSRANRGPTGYIEADGVLDMALRTRAIMPTFFDVRMTRETDKTVELYARAKIANSLGAKLLASFHTNAGPVAAEGVEVFYGINGDFGTVHAAEAKKLAKFIHDELVAATGMRARGIKTRLINNPDSVINGMDWYGVLRKTNCPAVIIEAGFHSNPVEETKLKNPEFRQLIAIGIARGFEKYASATGKLVKPKPEPEPEPIKEVVPVVEDKKPTSKPESVADWSDAGLRNKLRR